MNVHAQNDYPSPFQFQRIDSNLHGTKADLFVKANEWVAKTFVSAKDVIQMSDKEAGKILAKGVMEATGRVGITKCIFYIKFTLAIDVKDNKSRCKISEFIVEGYQSNGTFSEKKYFKMNVSLDDDPPFSYSRKTWNDLKYTCSYNSENHINDLFTALKAKSDNW